MYASDNSEHSSIMEQSAVSAKIEKQDIIEGRSFQGDHHVINTSRAIAISEEGPSYTEVKREYITTVGTRKEKTTSSTTKTRFVLSNLTALDLNIVGISCDCSSGYTFSSSKSGWEKKVLLRK